MTINHNDPEQFIRHIDTDAPAVDARELAAIRERTRAAFHDAAARRTSPAVRNAHGFPRGLVIFVALATLLCSIWLISPARTEAAPRLGELISQLQTASALHLSVREAGKELDILFHAPGTVRWNDENGRYRIANGNRLWRVDESSGNIAEEPSPLPAEGVTALELLELSEITDPTVLQSRPVGSERIDGTLCLVYRADIELRGEPVRLHAFADAAKGQLHTLRLLPMDSSRRNPTPVAEIRLLAMNNAVPEMAFTPRTSLADDGRIGVLSEAHGLVFVRAFPGHRWTPASDSLPLFVGDQLRCESRGANAVVIRLTSGTSITAGPSSQLEFTGTSAVRLQRGEARVQGATSQQPLTLTGRPGQTIGIHDSQLVRIDEEIGLTSMDDPPKWLRTLDENISTETMGSLITQVDGRDVELTLGFHHVSVEIRDQIARTVIEESFVNNTKERLEGTFHFPLPHDASISGFGMWIGGKLIEADIVERQRAREIFETIKRENRDPGLLEWAGGNIFKARVFPIEAHSQKRIRITYTQTLPLRNGTFRYAYALRSEMLQKNPLRDLSIDVTVHSATPLKTVSCPSHPATIQQTQFSARADYTARDVTPTRDFELLCTYDGRQSDVVAIPHIRGNDGYFMVQLSPPSAAGGDWSRLMVRDGTPLDVILLCDTSRSMDKPTRRQQLDVVNALLGTLSQSDHVRLACCDSEVVWLQQESIGVTDALREDLLSRLELRRSLGWSDLPGAFAKAFEAAAPTSHIIYIGDGTVTTAEKNSSDFIAALDRVAAKKDSPVCHAIAVGNTFDMQVLNAIGRVGRGTTRNASASAFAVDAVRDLMFEITRPGLRDIRVEFRNVQVAAVYPEKLPNLADGMQHILTGRFLPGSSDAAGEIMVSGMRGNETVTYAARLPLHVETPAGAQVPTENIGDASEGTADQNSFIPRLWAKAHIDHLLTEAATPQIQQSIIALSEKYHIITPYTSLLVLETEDDRKRFGVKRQFRMRDGEEFFAEGRKEAEYALKQQQIAAARLWRQQLFQQVRNQIDSYARTAVIPPPQQSVQLMRRFPVRGVTVFSADSAVQGIRLSDLSQHSTRTLESLFGDQDDVYSLRPNRDGYSRGSDAAWGGQFLTMFGRPSRSDDNGMYSGFSTDESLLMKTWADEGRFLGSDRFDRFNVPLSEAAPDTSGNQVMDSDDDAKLPIIDFNGYAPNFDVNGDGIADTAYSKRMQREFVLRDGTSTSGQSFVLDFVTESPHAFESIVGKSLGLAGRQPLQQRGIVILVEPHTFGIRDVLPAGPATSPSEVAWPQSIVNWPPSARHAAEQPAPPENDDTSSEDRLTFGWPDDVRAIVLALQRHGLQIGERGLSASQSQTRIHATRGTVTEQAWHEITWAPSVGWMKRFGSDKGPIFLWSANKESGSLSEVFGAGRLAIHPNFPEKVAFPETTLDQGLIAQLSGNTIWDAQVESRDNLTATLLLMHTSEPWKQARVIIDTSKNVIVEWTDLVDGRAVWIQRLADHVEIGGVWLPGSSEILTRQVLSDEVVLIVRTTCDWRELSVDDVRNTITERAEFAKRHLLLPDSLPTLEETRLALKEDKATLAHHLTRLFELWTQSRHDEALEQLDRLVAHHAAATPNRLQPQTEYAARWIRWLLLAESRHGQQLWRELTDVINDADDAPGVTLSEMITAIAPEDQPAARRAEAVAVLAETFRGFIQPRQSRQKQINTAKTLEDRMAAILPTHPYVAALMRERASNLYDLLRADEAIAVRREIVNRWPADTDAVRELAATLTRERRHEEARAVFTSALNDEQPRDLREWNALYANYLDWLRTRGEFENSLAQAERWRAKCRISSDAHGHFLRSLVELDRPDEVIANLQNWFTEGIADAPTPEIVAKLDVCINFAFGNLAGLSVDGPQLEFVPRMMAVAEHYAASDRYFGFANRILGGTSFDATPEGRATIQRVLATVPLLLSEISEARMNEFQNWLINGGLAETDIHTAILDAMRADLSATLTTRYRARARLYLMTWGLADHKSTTQAQQEQWYQALLTRWRNPEWKRWRQFEAQFIEEYVSRVYDDDERLKWDRTRLAEAADDEVQGARYLLFRSLLNATWTEERELETFRLIPMISTAEDGTALQMAMRLPLLNEWVSRMTSARLLKANREIEDRDELTPDKRRHYARVHRVSAVRAIIRILSNAVDDDEVQPNDKAWLRIHRMILNSELAQAELSAGVTAEEQLALLRSLIDESRSLLGDEPKPSPDPAQEIAEDEVLQQILLDIRLRHICFAVWMHAAIRLQDATGQDATSELLAYIRRGAVIDTVAPRAWHAAEFGLLIALDRAPELEKRLRQWMGDDVATSPWRIMLAQLLAEQDRLPEAIMLYERAAREDALTVADWNTLSTWQHALDRRDDYEQSRREIWKRSSAQELQQQLLNELNAWRANTTSRTPGIPEDVKLRFKYLFEKTGDFPGAMNVAASWHKATNDPLVLKPLAAYVTGRSRSGMLDAAETTHAVVQAIETETAVDVIMQHLATERDRVRREKADDEPQRAVDLRGLSILEMQAAVRAARVVDQQGQYAPRAVRAMKDAASGDWQEGERMRFTSRLNDFGQLPDASVRAARIEVMTELMNQEPPGTLQRLQLADILAQALMTDSRDDDATVLLQREIASFRAAERSQWPGEADTALDRLLRLLRRKNRFLASERLVLELQTEAIDQNQLNRLNGKLREIRVDALRRGGRVSVGQGTELYEFLRNTSLDDLTNQPHGAYSGQLDAVASVFRAAGAAKLPRIADDVVTFVTTQAEPLIRRRSDEFVRTVNTMFDLLRRINSQDSAVVFLLERMEARPVAILWARPHEAWEQFSDELARYSFDDVRNEKDDVTGVRFRASLAEHRERIESELVRGFESALRRRRDHHLEYFAPYWTNAWNNGKQLVYDAVDRVAADQKDSQPHLQFVVQFLTRHYKDDRKAVGILLDANDRRVLDTAGQNQLVDLLFETNRHAEAVPVLLSLIEDHPANLNLRLRLMTAYFRTERANQLQATLDAILEQLVDPKETDINSVWQLANACRNCELWSQAAELYDAGITRRGWPTSPDGALSDAWRELAKCRTKLDEPVKALEAISAAFVVGGNDNHRRNLSRTVLREVLQETDDITIAVGHMERVAAETNEESSILRRAVGRELMERGQWAAAEPQLRIALELQPVDEEAWGWLVECLDKTDQPQAAIVALLDQSDTDRRNLDIYKHLYQRLTNMVNTPSAERAATSIVEVAPLESENHSTLGELRQEASDLPAAAHHFLQAADLKKEEPGPLLKLVDVQYQMKDWTAAGQTLKRLETTKWDDRFTLLPKQVEHIRRKLKER